MAIRLSALPILVLAAASTQAANPYAPDTAEPGSVEAIAAATTEPRFGNPWVAYVPESKTAPSPSDSLGHIAGAPGELSSTAKIYAYFRALDAASDRVSVETIGKSEEGRDIILAAISDEEGIRDLAKLKAATAALADPRRTSPEEAEKIIATARPIYYFNAGLHSTETGPPEMVMELAYRLAVSDQPMIQEIRRNVVVLINPVAEPDGRDKVVDWFYKYLKGKTDFDNLPWETPPYWGYYVFHDNNRDTHQAALECTRAVHRMFFDYHPTVVHDLHESIPLLHTWNGTGPYNSHLDPILTDEWLATSFHEITALTSLGMPGVWTWGFGEGWGQHYLDSLADNHNSLGRGYETFGNSTAETVERTLWPSDERYVGKPVTEKDWYRAWPPERKFRWSLRDNTNYMETGALSILQYTARNAKDLLRNFYRKGFNSLMKGKTEKPFAYVIPEDQGDRRRVAQMVNLLLHQRFEVSRATAPIKVKEGEFPSGTFVVRLDQPYRNYALDLLENQKYPESPYTPYDDVSWSLPVHYGLDAKRIDDEKIKDTPLKPVESPVRPAEGKVNGTGPVFLLKDTGQEGLLAARAALADFKIEIAEQSFKSGETDYPAGSWIVSAQSAPKEGLERAAADFALDFESAASAPEVARHAARLPRLAVWHTWMDTESVGWIRYALDQEKIPYTYIRDEEIRTWHLHDRFDVILFGNVDLDLKEIVNGIDTKYGPMPYRKTPQTPNLGVPDSSDDITGGIGWTGMENLRQFLADGGILITLANGSTLPIEGGLVRGVGHASGNEIDTPGSELRVKLTRPDHPLAYGYPAITSVFRQNYPVYSIRPADRRWIVMQWGTRPPKDEREDSGDGDGTGSSGEADADSTQTASGEKGGKEKAASEEEALVVSGGAKGEEDLEGRPAILDLPAPYPGKGHVLAYNFNPMHRDLNHSDYRFLWNAILNWSALPPAIP